jgi:LysM repeat protein
MKRPPIHSSTSSVINSYRKRRQRRGPNLIYIAAGILILGGVILLIAWLTGPSKPLSAMFATDTPTPTVTFTPTSTSTPTEMPTITPTATVTTTSTPSAPFSYTVLEGDTLTAIVQKFNLGDNGIKLILMLNPYNAETDTGVDPATQFIVPGEVLTLPYPGMPVPTATPVPAELPSGTKIDYFVEPGDTLAVIAAKFHSTEEEIIAENKLEDANTIFAGQLLVIPVNIVTPTATRPPTSTPATPVTPAATATQ